MWGVCGSGWNGRCIPIRKRQSEKQRRTAGVLLLFARRIARDPGFLRYTMLGSLIIPGKNREKQRNSRDPIFGRRTQASFRRQPCPRKTRPEQKLRREHGSHSPKAGVYRFRDPPSSGPRMTGINRQNRIGRMLVRDANAHPAQSQSQRNCRIRCNFDPESAKLPLSKMMHRK